MSSNNNSTTAGDDDDDVGDHPKKQPHHHDLYTKLAAITNSSGVNKTSILLDATRYIEDLKRKVDHHLISDQDQTTASASASSSSGHPPLSDDDDQVKVETLETGGLLIKVLLERNVPGLLVSVLEAFEHLGLDLLDARVSNSPHNFHLHAISTGHSDGGINVQLVKQAVVQAISNWVDTSDDDDDKDQD